jgi:2-methylcitrate dehydratase PrpD
VAGYGKSLGTGDCHAIGAGRLAATGAAFVNGAYGNVLEMDDIHRAAILPAGPVVIPAALAVAERQGADAREFLSAVVRGYEAMIRIGRSVGPHHYRFWHKTSPCGPFGAAAAAASLLRLDPARTVWALGNAGTQASGPWQCRLEGAMSKQLHTPPPLAPASPPPTWRRSASPGPPGSSKGRWDSSPRPVPTPTPPRCCGTRTASG